MNISDQKIKQFQDIYHRHFKEKISEQDAFKMGQQLVSAINIIQNYDSKKRIPSGD